MKVRWTRGSLRLRITPAELEELLAGRGATERLELPGGSWTVRLASADATGVALDGGELRFGLGPDDRARLGEPEREGVYFAVPGLRYLVEKDFPCAHPRSGEAEEAATETFAPPPGFVERRAG